MTITSMAKQLGVSTMTIYRRCKRNGVAIDELRDGATGELTAAGVSVIASMFDATTPQVAGTGDAACAPQGCNDDAQTVSQGDLAVQVAALTATVDGLRGLVDQLTGERDELRRQVTALTAALEREQADRQAERRLLTAGDGGEAGQPRRWRWPWARR